VFEATRSLFVSTLGRALRSTCTNTPREDEEPEGIDEGPKGDGKGLVGIAEDLEGIDDEGR